MSEQPAKPLEVLPSSNPEEEIYAWRKECFLTLGFSDIQSGALARKKDVDHHKVSKVVAEGCPVTTAVRIFL